MKKKTIWILLLLIIVGGGIFFLTRGDRELGDPPGEPEVVEEAGADEEQEGGGSEEASEDEETEYTGDTDFSSFSSEKQVLGQESEAEFSIDALVDTSRDGYHEFIFSLSTEDDGGEPFVTATYLPSQGVIRMDFQGIRGDSTGIGYQQEREVNEQGVSRIYHNISSQNDQELYDVGVSKATIFYLTSEEVQDGKWSIILQVKYPGVSNIDVDLGSEEFSEDEQSIEGVTAVDGAAISAYTYSGTSGLLKLVWSVRSDGDNPIPSVSASYNEDDDLVVTFESLNMDRVASFADALTLPSSITAEIVRESESSVYTFTGMDGVREFKLSASLSPNQVILEIR